LENLKSGNSMKIKNLSFKIGLIYTIILFMGLSGTINAQQEYKQEVRGVWITNVDSDVLYSKDKLAEAMDYLASRGFNMVYPVVWNKGVTLHPSTVAQNAIGVKQDSFFATQGRDPLAEIIAEAHRVGMEVVPWFEYGFASSFSENGGHIIAKNPHWAARNANGDIVTKNGFDWMNAIHPEVQQFMLDMIQEVIENYDVDGIQGDDRLPAMAAEGGYDDYTNELYKSEHNGSEPSVAWNSDIFMAWKADKITAFAGRLYRMVKSVDPNLIVSLSPSIFDFSYRNYLQDWPTWLDSAYVDVIHPQAYRYNIADYKTLINGMVGPVPNSPGGIVKPNYRHKLSPGILIKAGNQFNGPDYVKQAVQYHRDFGIKGEVFFFYEGLREKNQFVADTLFKYFYNQPAILPIRNSQIRRPKAIIVNETDADVERFGSWSITDTPDGFSGKSLRAQPNSGAELRYIADIPYSAYYHVYAWIPFNSTATADAKFVINGKNEEQSTTFNQRVLTNKGWKQVGNVYFDRGLQQIVGISTDDITDNKVLYADAVMLILDRQKSPDIEIDVFTTNTEDEQGSNLEIPTSVQLHQNFPNPFNPSTTIRFDLNKSSNISLEVYSMLGQKVATLISNSVYGAGMHSISFNASNLASGNYFYQLKTEQFTATRTLTFIK